MKIARLSSQVTRLPLLIVCAILICAATCATAQFSTLYRFGQSPNDGVGPQGGLIADAAGNLYGTASGGGLLGGGTVFELSPPASSGPWTETILYNFSSSGSGGVAPESSLVFDTAGNLYGTTANGGGANGTVFQLVSPGSSGAAWTYNVLYTFQGGNNDGEVPFSGLIFDSAGNLYGTTFYGGPCNNGSVFELSPPAAPGGAWIESVLHFFRFSCNGRTGPDGAGPYGPLALIDKALYGTTWSGGGTTDSGIVFKLSPPIAGNTTWREQSLYTFTGGPDGGHPSAGLAHASFLRNNLYGTTQYGGNESPCSNGIPGCGVVFELSPPSIGGGAWTETVIYSFVNGSDGSLPSSPVIFGVSGDLYSTTSVGGGGTCDYISDAGCGAVFKLKPSGSGGPWVETTLHSFTGNTSGDQGADVSGLVFGRSQKLCGTTGVNNVGGFGTIFSVVP
jgi:uncharacterized repeat protein (TIGR03803 family)